MPDAARVVSLSLTAEWEAANGAGDEAQSQGEYAIAEQHYLAAVRIAEQLGLEDPRLATALLKLGRVHFRAHRYVEGEECLQRAVGVQERLVGPDHPTVASLLQQMAKDCSNRGEPDRAVPLLMRAISIYEKTKEPDHRQVLDCLTA